MPSGIALAPNGEIFVDGYGVHRFTPAGNLLLSWGKEGNGPGEFVNLHNIGTEPQILCRGDKIAQAVVVPVVHARFVASETPDVYDWYPITISNRGDGALGSTGK